MKRLYLHIGTSKTGTTLLQRRFSQQRRFLRSAGYLYPETQPDDAIGHHRLARSFLGPGLADPESVAYRSEFFTGLASEPLEKALVSSELFCQLGPAEIERLATEVERHGFEPTVVLYFRRQDRFLISNYQALVRRGVFIGSFDEFVEHQLFQAMRRFDPYPRLADRWARTFPGLRIAVYDNVEPDQFFPWFLQNILEIESSRRSFTSSMKSNPASGAVEVELLRRTWRLVTEQFPQRDLKPMAKGIREAIARLLKPGDHHRIADVLGSWTGWPTIARMFRQECAEIMDRHQARVINAFNDHELFDWDSGPKNELTATAAHERAAAVPDRVLMEIIRDNLG